MSDKQIYDAIVVGCGASGIAALSKLHKAGLAVLGLEAADRIGGRICTIPYGENVVDLGAQWCHGETDNIVYHLVQDLNVLGRPKPDTKVYVQSNGKELLVNDVEELLQRFESFLEEANKDNDKSIPEYLRERLDQEVENGKIKDKKLSYELLEFFKRVNHMAGSSDPEEHKSLRGLSESKPCEGEFMLNWKDKGFISFINILLDGKNIEILTKKEVETIRWSSDKITGNVAPLVQIKCKDGSLYAAKHIIVTMSVGVLKERYTMFTPSLPEEKLKSINNLTMSILDKIYIEFSKPWWDAHPSYITIVWSEEDKKKWLLKDQWITEVYALSTVEHQTNILCAWIYGNGAVAMEAQSEDNVRNGVDKLLKHLFGPKVSDITNIMRTKWASNRFVRGTYSYRSVNTEKTSSSASKLSQPLYSDGHPIVCFAGEATSVHHHGSVHGAVEAGFREADRIINYRKLTLTKAL